jgi:hypothetical protein
VPDKHGEVTAAAIARLAGVGRAAVSNWRRRYPEFPKPVGGSPASPTFSWAEVEGWLTTTGKADQLATAGRTTTGTQRISEPASRSAVLAAGRPERRGQGGQPGGPERAVTDLAAGELLARVVVSLLPHSTTVGRLPGAYAGEDIDETGDGDGLPRPVVLDPACATGTLLMATADRFGDGVRVAGQEISEPAAATAALNLRGHPHGPIYEVHTGDSLLDNRLGRFLGAAAAVVCEPPFDLPRWPADALTTDPRWEFGIPAPRDGELAWVQHCYAHLRPRGVAVVAVSPRTCVQGSGQHIRAALVRSGVLRDVIALPAGMSSVPGADVCLWVLRRPYGGPEDATVRMVDLSRLCDAADAPHEFAAWQRLFEGADPAICRPVPRLELLDGDANLLPSHYLATRTEPTADDLGRVTGRLEALYARIGRGLPRFAAPEAPVRRSYVTLGELERAGALTIRSRETTPLAGDVLLRTLGRPPAVASGLAADETGIAQVVEINQSRLDPYFVATFLRADAGSLPVANTLGALSRDDLRRCRIPRMPVAEQRQYGDMFRRLSELADTLAALAAVSMNVIDQAVHGMITGALAPNPAATNDNEKSDPTEGETRDL